MLLQGLFNRYNLYSITSKRKTILDPLISLKEANKTLIY
jgi:hypothetical protein